MAAPSGYKASDVYKKGRKGDKEMAKEKKGKKKIVLAVIIILLLLAVAGGFFGYSYLSGHMDILSKNIISYDDKFSMDVPFSWEKSSGASPYAVIAAENADNSMYAMVSVKRDGAGAGLTLEEYIYEYINQIAQNSDDELVQVISIPPTEGKLGENTGYYFELDSMSDGLALHLWDFVFVADGGYVHVNVASSGEDLTKASETAKGIIASVKYLNGTAVTPAQQ